MLEIKDLLRTCGPDHLSEIKDFIEDLLAAKQKSQSIQQIKQFDLERKKAFRPATYKQIQYAEKLADKTNSKLPSTSQMLKYCEGETMSECIDAMLAGEQIELS